MSDNPSVQLEARRVKEQLQLKKLLPRGTCLVQEYKKYDYIRALLKDRFAYRFILPMSHVYAPFVVVRRQPEGAKYPLYHLYYHPTQAFVLAAQEQSMNIGCNYLISSNERPAKDECFIAKLRGNFQRNQFHLFDNGSNPDRAKGNPRRQLAYLTIEEGSIWNRNEKLSMYVPRAYESNRSISQIHRYEPIEFPCQSGSTNPILQDFKQKYNTVESLQLKELKQPRGKGPQGTGYILESSVRTESLVVRKKSETYYELGIGSPLTIVQGFGFLITLIEAKLI